MCGIAGAVGGGPGIVERMVERLGHRGPDGTAVAAGARARLGCARLSIRGGAAGAQPLRTRKGLLVFNGEIYNTVELEKDLAWHGVEVDGDSDTAVVGALLDVYGIRAVDRLNGMYALAFDDGEQVWLARDPAGIKPLYYRGARFASEIRPLLDEGAELHPPAVARWLTFHAAHGTETFFRGVRRVPPGGIVSLPAGRVERAGDPVLTCGDPNPALDAARLRKVLERAVRDAAPADRYGVALSGGIDSTLVAALARGYGAPVAYHGHVDFDGCDESAYARAAADALDLELVLVPITAGSCVDALPRVVEALEEPVAGPGSLAQWQVAERAAKDVRILLSGCGGDELFGGYARACAMVFDAPPPGLEAYAPLFARVRGLPAEQRAFALLDRRTPGLFTRDFLAAHAAPEREFFDLFGARAAQAELAITLPALLQVEDRVTMAFSLEGRVPLLDRRLLRSATRLAPAARVDEDGRLKALFRDAAAPHLPEAVRTRRDKMGFPLPLGDWLATDRWRSFTRDVLLGPRTRERGMIEARGVEAALENPGRYDRGLYSVLALELWCRTFLDE